MIYFLSGFFVAMLIFVIVIELMHDSYVSFLDSKFIINKSSIPSLDYLYSYVVDHFSDFEKQLDSIEDRIDNIDNFVFDTSRFIKNDK